MVDSPVRPCNRVGIFREAPLDRGGVVTNLACVPPGTDLIEKDSSTMRFGMVSASDRHCLLPREAAPFGLSPLLGFEILVLGDSDDKLPEHVGELVLEPP